MPFNIATVDPSTAISYAVVVHLIFYSTVTIWGVIAMVRYGVELGATAALAWEAKPVGLAELASESNFALITSVPSLKSEELPIKLTPFWIALTEAICPAVAKIDSTQQKQACTMAAQFLCEELSALPLKLRTLIKIGMFGFRFIAIAFGLNLFENLSLDKRVTLVNAWSFGKIELTRKMFKPLRSIALLAYFEDSAVQKSLDDMEAERKTGTVSPAMTEVPKP
ncbi:MAG: hypothetical protein IPL73_02835 [Candidatus Obscuribacter sp.]|nr:hypothetical protein [Candidatus Obscuribacter sp.]